MLKLENIILLFIIVVLPLILIIIEKLWIIRNNKIRRKYINRILKLSRTSDIAIEITKASFELFHFDYLTISIVDHINDEIKTEYSYSQDTDLVDPESWREKSSYSLNYNDILCHIVRTKSTEIRIGRRVNIDKDTLLNKDIFINHNHQMLNRFFIPLFNVTEQEKTTSKNLNDNSIVIGTMELGFHNNTKKNIKKKLIKDYKDFIKDFEWSICKAVENYENSIIESIIKKYLDSVDYSAYLLSILNEVIELFEIEVASYSFESFNDETIIHNILDYNSFNHLNSILKSALNVHHEKLIKEIIAEPDKDFSISKLDQKFLKNYETEGSSLVVKLHYYNIVIGFVCLDSSKIYFFNKKKAELIHRIFTKAIPDFYKVKLNYFSKIIFPAFDIFNGTYNLQEIVVKNLQHFFNADYIGFWERELIYDSKYDSRFRIKDSTESLRKEIEQYNFDIVDEKFIDNVSQIKWLYKKGETTISNEVVEFCEKSGFKSMFVFPILIDMKRHGFIGIFSKRILSKLFPEQIIYINQLANKIALELLYTRIIDSYVNISESTTHNEQEILLQNIVENARNVTLADLVLLYEFNSELNRFEKNLIYSGELYEPKLKQIILEYGVGENELLNTVIDSEPIWINYGDEEIIHLINRKKKNSHFKDRFWIREKVKSMAAIGLKHNNKPLGIIFFNFRRPQDFNESSKKLMLIFSKIAANAIANSKVIKSNHEFLITNIKLTQPLIEGMYISSLAHNAKNIFDSILAKYKRFEEALKYKGLNDSRYDVVNLMKELKEPFEELNNDFMGMAAFNREKIISNKEIFELSKILNNSVEIVSTRLKSKRINIETEFNTEVYINGSKNQIEHVFINILVNAIQAITKNGIIRIEHSFQENDKMVRIVIKNNGPRINDNIIDKLSNVYFSYGKKDGTGLGLTISKLVIEEHKGKLLWKSNNDWTTFIIDLPYLKM